MTFSPINWLSFMAFQVLFCYLSPFPTIISLSTSPNDLTTWENIFQDRSDDEWRALWHTERHRRCYQELESHMKWVCNKDIYKVKKSDSEIESVSSPHREPRGICKYNFLPNMSVFSQQRVRTIKDNFAKQGKDLSFFQAQFKLSFSG